MILTGYQLLIPVKDLDGETIPRRKDTGEVMTEEKEGKTQVIPLTVKQVLRNALTTTLRGLEEDEKRKTDNYAQAKKILAVEPDGEIEIPTSELAYIIKKMKLSWGIEVSGFVEDILEGRNKDFAK
jgi:hypothetical protein